VDRFVKSLDPGAGSGYGAYQAARAVPSGYSGNIVLIPGDVIAPESALRVLREAHEKGNPTLTLLTAETRNPDGKGRIVRRKDGTVERIMEQSDIDKMIQAAGGEVTRSPTKRIKDLKPPSETDKAKLAKIEGATLTLRDGTVLTGMELHQIVEINLGIYAAKSQELFEHLKGVQDDKREGEWYATDVIITMNEQGQKVKAVPLRDPEDLRKLSGANNVYEFIQIVSEYLTEILKDPDAVFAIQETLRTQFSRINEEAPLLALNRVLMAARAYEHYPTRESGETFASTFTRIVVEAAKMSPSLITFYSVLGGRVSDAFITENGNTSADGGTKLAASSITPGAIIESTTYEANLAGRLGLQTGMGQAFFMEEVQLLDPTNRQILGEISEKVIFPGDMADAIEAQGLSPAKLIALYILLARYFEGVPIERIELSETLDVQRLTDPLVDLALIKDSSTPKDLIEEILGLAFTPKEMQKLEDLKRQAIEAQQMIESQV